jgi:predicted nucleic acid-binding protein
VSLYVVDASVALSWSIRTQRTEACDALINDPNATFISPFSFIYEMRNALLKAERQKRVRPEVVDTALDLVASLVSIDTAPDATKLDAVWTLARACAFGFHDASYVVLAMTLNAPLATRDKAQIRVGPSLGVTIYNAL